MSSIKVQPFPMFKAFCVESLKPCFSCSMASFCLIFFLQDRLFKLNVLFYCIFQKISEVIESKPGKKSLMLQVY